MRSKEFFSTTRTCQRIFESQFRKALYATKTYTTNDGKVVSLALVPTVQATIPSSFLPQLELEAKFEFHIPVVVTCQAVCGSVEPTECWSGLWLQSLNEQLAKVDVVEYVVRCGAENELLVLTPWQAKALGHGRIRRKIARAIQTVSRSRASRTRKIQEPASGLRVLKEIWESIAICPFNENRPDCENRSAFSGADPLSIELEKT